MTIKASKIPSVKAMSRGNILFKHDMRSLLCSRIPDLFKCLDALGSDPIICQTNKALKGKIQHVDLTQYYEYVGQIVHHLTQAYNLAGLMHNEQTAHGEEIGIEMDSPNGGGTDR